VSHVAVDVSCLRTWSFFFSRHSSLPRTPPTVPAIPPTGRQLSTRVVYERHD
jgi:hypothetical protein